MTEVLNYAWVLIVLLHRKPEVLNYAWVLTVYCYSYKCDQETNRLATLDYGQRWLALNPIPNKLHSDKNSHFT